MRALPPLEAGRGYAWIAAQVRLLVEEHQIGSIVVGLPRNMDGSEGPGAAAARRLAEQIGIAVGGVPLVLYDERLTTVLAEQALIQADLSRKNRRKLIDGQAAVVLLTDYLKSASSVGPPAAPQRAENGVSTMANEEREDIVILTDDEGNEVEFLFLDAFEIDERRYAVLIPLESTEESESGDEEVIEGSEAMIFRLEQDEHGDEVFVEIEDDDEWAEVTAAWEDLQDEDLAAEDEDDEDDDEDDDADDEEDAEEDEDTAPKR